MEYDIGAVTRLNMNKYGSTLLFNNINGKNRFRIISNILPAKKDNLLNGLGYALGLKENTDFSVTKQFKKSIESPPTPPIITKESINRLEFNGADVNLKTLPSPLFRKIDGGYYLGTWHIDITPGIKTKNDWGMFRHMVHDERHLGIFFTDETKHMYQVFQKYSHKGQDTPIVIATGNHPILPITAGIHVPDDVEENELAGSIMGMPLKMTESKLFGKDILVPCNTEIILEGYILNNELREEGDFGVNSL